MIKQTRSTWSAIALLAVSYIATMGVGVYFCRRAIRAKVTKPLNDPAEESLTCL